MPTPVELRLLTGPNVYFTRPAVKLTLDASGVLEADPARVVGWQRALRTPDHAVGLPGSPTRAVAAAELAAALVRRAGYRLGLRVAAIATPADDNTVVVAFPFRRRGIGEAFGEEVAAAYRAVTVDGATPSAALAGIKERVTGREPGEPVRPLRPRIPVIAVTGTNGKTTTTRLIAHLMRADGRVPGWSSTDGIVIDGETVETGDWSGPGGAARVLEDPRVTVAVTETARGGILLRGVGTAVNDVSVVTNISADHLGLLGVHTIEQLAEVKSVVARITKPTGWTVLNADDPLVRAMRTVSRARPWFYSPDPENPYLAEALDAGGRAITVLDGVIAVLERGLEPRLLLPVAEVPLTLAGTSRVNVANTLAATAAALAIGAKPDAVREGLRTFSSSAADNAGRLNVYGVGTCAVVLDLAHNEASLESLLEVAGRLRTGSGELVAILGTAGDRTDEAIHAMGSIAAAAADRLMIAGKDKYLRDRAPGEMEQLWRAGAAEAGTLDVPEAPDELTALATILDSDLPEGSAVAVCALEQRAEMAEEILRRGGREMDAAEIAARVHG
ncbi:Mur ligase [Nakamurella sp. YIM 132087]|uniref:Mur ligase n=1 Tax=Nakamurella alba TaxID=2665158 RepID=A0A7K1FT31_9ACTN|nr:Mur ligase family protein [Nakamurella alba]MTD17288.1 Mur ligase [Nakamurella alba]